MSVVELRTPQFGQPDDVSLFQRAVDAQLCRIAPEVSSSSYEGVKGYAGVAGSTTPFGVVSHRLHCIEGEVLAVAGVFAGEAGEFFVLAGMPAWIALMLTLRRCSSARAHVARHRRRARQARIDRLEAQLEAIGHGSGEHMLTRVDSRSCS